MCTGVVYWSGIRRIVFAVSKNKVSGSYFETPEDTSGLVSKFNENIEMIHLSELEKEALQVVKEWENKMALVG